MSLDAVISADLVKTRAEIAALGSAVAAARNEIAGLNTQVSGNSAIKSVQRLRIQPIADNTSRIYHSDVTISAINPLKSIVLIRRIYSGSRFDTIFLDCEILTPTQLRCSSYAYYEGSYNAISGPLMDIQVVEFK
ncbi:hypothetical protein [Delftia lacustris]|uniref:hypothetical protein n=1 Tax=Delftia lacustris TaxID=558537 RepID=UPI001FCB2327|nr:hypothetical protein [Delftia lacustris]BDE72843.1 hypothetical protein HQS1_39670 [Delftia lacustris]